MFGKKTEKKPEPPKDHKKQLEKAATSESSRVDELLRRIRLIEERYSGLRKKSQLIEQNMLNETRDLNQEMTVINNTVKELKKDISELNDKLGKLGSEVQGSVRKAEFSVFAKYLELWQPMDFLTRKEAQQIIDDHITKIKMASVERDAEKPEKEPALSAQEHKSIEHMVEQQQEPKEEPDQKPEEKTREPQKKPEQDEKTKPLNPKKFDPNMFDSGFIDRLQPK